MPGFKDYKDLSTGPLDSHQHADGSLMNAPGLTDEVFHIIVDAMEAGAGLNLAAQAAGFSQWTVRFWLRQAKVLAEQGLTAQDDIRIALAEAMPQARAKRAVEALKAIQKAGQAPQFWTAAAWYLERTYPELYGKQDRKPMDWMEELRKQGIDPQTAFEMMVKELGEQATDEEIVDGDIVE